MSNDVYLIKPKTFTESMELCKFIANSSFAPTQMKGKPADILLALQLGSEVGLSPMQALQNIGVINNKPCLYGDGLLAVALASPAYISHREWTTGSIEDGTLTAHCGVTRKGSDEHVKSFSMDQAKKASLWGKSGPWSTYPERMLQMRARAFAIRDKFADALRGINSAEELQDYQPILTNVVNVTSEPTTLIEQNIPSFQTVEPISDEQLGLLILAIRESQTKEQLKESYLAAKEVVKYMPEIYKSINELTFTRKKEIEEQQVKDFNAEIDAADEPKKDNNDNG